MRVQTNSSAVIRAWFRHGRGAGSRRVHQRSKRLRPNDRPLAVVHPCRHRLPITGLPRTSRAQPREMPGRRKVYGTAVPPRPSGVTALSGSVDALPAGRCSSWVARIVRAVRPAALGFAACPAWAGWSGALLVPRSGDRAAAWHMLALVAHRKPDRRSAQRVHGRRPARRRSAIWIEPRASPIRSRPRRDPRHPATHPARPLPQRSGRAPTYRTHRARHAPRSHHEPHCPIHD